MDQEPLRLDEQEQVEERQQSDYAKPHDDLLTTHDENHDLLYRRLRPTTFPMGDETEKQLDKLTTLFNALADKGICQGLAANQAGVTVNAFWAKLQNGKRRLFINPEIVSHSPKRNKKGWEGCMSLPYVGVWVPRWREVRIRYQDEDGDEHFEAFSGRWSRIIQHEIDHLNGIVISDYYDPEMSMPPKRRGGPREKGNVGLLPREKDLI